MYFVHLGWALGMSVHDLKLINQKPCAALRLEDRQVREWPGPNPAGNSLVLFTCCVKDNSGGILTSSWTTTKNKEVLAVFSSPGILAAFMFLCYSAKHNLIMLLKVSQVWSSSVWSSIVLYACNKTDRKIQAFFLTVQGLINRIGRKQSCFWTMLWQKEHNMFSSWLVLVRLSFNTPLYLTVACFALILPVHSWLHISQLLT